MDTKLMVDVVTGVMGQCAMLDDFTEHRIQKFCERLEVAFKEAAAGAPDLRSAIPTWQERMGLRDCSPYSITERHMQAEIDDLRAALASAAPVEALTCAWTPDADYEAEAWHSSCGEAWSFIDGGPKENCVRFCQGCGKPVAIQARAIEARIMGGAK